ncbi:MAG: Ku protein [Deltaproteobacteria bacterium]|nr:Ku protein [Deltaproteobacteria bacterium]
MAAIWKGGINFGLVHIPVVLHSAETRDEIDFTMLDRRDHSRVRYRRVNENSGKEVPWEEIVKGYEYDKGQYIEMTDEDFKRARLESTQNVHIVDFVERAQIPPAYYDKPYYLVPTKAGIKGYTLLRETLKRVDRVAVSKVTIRTKEYLAGVFVEDYALLLILFRYHHELKEPSQFDLPHESLKALHITEKEINMAIKLVEDMTAEWKPEQYVDAYHDALSRIINEKISHRPARHKPAPADEAKVPGKVIDIMELLQRSVAQQEKKKRSGNSKRKERSGKKRRVA